MTRLLKVIGSVLLGIGVALMLLGLYVLNNARTFAAAAQPATGIVMEKEPGTTTSNAFVRYRFWTPDGREFKGDESVRPEVFNALRVEGPAPVRYLPDHPETHHLEGTESGGSVVLLAGSAFAGVGGLLLFMGMRVDAADARLRRDGVLVEATVTGTTATSVEVNGVRQGRIEYTFSDDGGGQQRGRSRMMPLSDAQRWAEGDRGYVRYDRNQPGRSLWLGHEDA